MDQIENKLASGRKDLEYLTLLSEVVPYSPAAEQQIEHLLKYQFDEIYTQANELILEHEQFSASLDKVERQLHYELDEKMMTNLLKKMSNLSKEVAMLGSEKG